MSQLQGDRSFVICGYDERAQRITSAERTPVYHLDRPTALLIPLNQEPTEGTTHFMLFATKAGEPNGHYFSIRGDVCPRVPSTHRYIAVDFDDADLCIEMPVPVPAQVAARFVEQRVEAAA